MKISQSLYFYLMVFTGFAGPLHAQEQVPPQDPNSPIHGKSDDELNAVVAEAVEETPADKAFDAAVAEARAATYREGKTVTLEQAMLIALDKHPQIELARQDAEVAKALLTQFQSIFDPVFFLEISHGKEHTPASPAQLLRQRTLSGLRSSGQSSSANSNQVLSQLERQAAALSAEATAVNQINGFGSTARDDQRFASDFSERDVQNLRRVDSAFDDAFKDFQVRNVSRTNTTQYETGFRKQFRSGLNGQLKGVFDRSATDGVTAPVNRGTIELEMMMPLGKGRGAKSLVARERAAKVDLEASFLNLRHSVSAQLSQTAMAYWRCVVAQKEYALLRGAEKIAYTFVELAEFRVQEEDIAPVDLSTAKAQHSQAMSERIGSEFILLAARRELGILMGLSAEEMFEPPFAADEFPSHVNMDAIRNMGDQSFMKHVLKYRDDLAATQMLIRSGKLLADAALFDIKPRADLFANFGVATVDQGSHFSNNFSTFTSGASGVSAQVGLSIEWPFHNRAARADHALTIAELEKQRISARDLERNIVSSVLLAKSQVDIMSRKVNAGSSAVNYAAKSLDAQRIRYKEGEGSLIDTFQQQNQLTEAIQELLQTKLQYAVSISNLRFESGTLLKSTDGPLTSDTQFQANKVMTIPDFSNVEAPVVPVVSVEPQPAGGALPLAGKDVIQSEAPAPAAAEPKKKASLMELIFRKRKKTAASQEPLEGSVTIQPVQEIVLEKPAAREIVTPEPVEEVVVKAAQKIVTPEEDVVVKVAEKVDVEEAVVVAVPKAKKKSRPQSMMRKRFRR